MTTAVARREPTEIAEQQDPQVEAIKRILSQRTPKDEVRERTGRGGLKLKYTDGAYVIRTLNAAFGWDWDFVADSEELLTNNGKPFEVKVRGSLTVRMGGRTITKTQYGCQPIEMLKNADAPVSIGDAYKGAATDAMKKCASLLGIALDLYDSDYKAEKYAESEPEAAQPEPVRTVKLEGPQPKDGVTEWPRTRGLVGMIFAKCQSLNWTAANLADEIERRFQIVMPEHAIITGLADALTPQELRTLDQSLAGEFNSRSRTR